MDISECGLPHDPLLDIPRFTNNQPYRIKIAVIITTTLTVLLIVLSFSMVYILTKKQRQLSSSDTVLKLMNFSTTTATTTTTIKTTTTFVVKANKSTMSTSTNCSETSWNPEGDVVASGYLYCGLTIDDDFNVYVTTCGQCPIQKWLPGAKVPINLPNTTDALSCLFFHSSTYSLYFYSIALANPSIYKLMLRDTTRVKVAFGNWEGSARNQLGSCQGLYVSTMGDIFVVDGSNDRVLKWSVNATYGIVVAGGSGRGNGPTQLSSPIGFFVEMVNNVIYVLDSDNHRIQKYINGSRKGVTVISAAANSIFLFNWPQGIIIDRNGNFLIAEPEKITRWTPDYAFSYIVADNNQELYNDMMPTFTPTTRPTFDPTIIAFDKQQNLYAIDWTNRRVVRFNSRCEFR